MNLSIKNNTKENQASDDFLLFLWLRTKSIPAKT